jgi:hypothetical protein
MWFLYFGINLIRNSLVSFRNYIRKYLYYNIILKTLSQGKK